MNEQEYLKNLSYEVKYGYIKYFDKSKGSGWISSDTLEDDIFFQKKDIFNNDKIEQDYEVEFILDDINTKKIRAEKILIKQKRKVTSLYCRVVDNRKETWKVLDNFGNQYFIHRDKISNYDNYDENSFLYIELINDIADQGKIVFKGYKKRYNDEKQQKYVSNKIFSIDSDEKFSFKPHSLLNANNIKDKEIVYFVKNEKIFDDGGVDKFATDIFITKEKYNG
jgi:cold shock CspA family protein